MKGRDSCTAPPATNRWRQQNVSQLQVFPKQFLTNRFLQRLGIAASEHRWRLSGPRSGAPSPTTANRARSSGTASSQASSGGRTRAPTRLTAPRKSRRRFYGLAQVAGAPGTHVGVPLACDRRRSRRKPAGPFLPGKRGARVTAASRQIARKRYSYSGPSAGLVEAADRLRTKRRGLSGTDVVNCWTPTALHAMCSSTSPAAGGYWCW